MRTLPLDDRRRPRLLRLRRARPRRRRRRCCAGTRCAPCWRRRWRRPRRRRPPGVATGHAHIDTAWLWPLGETVRKCVRTFASAVALMDDEPDFRFSCSQAQQYAWVAAREPELFDRIADKVAAGQWIPVGRDVGRARHEPAVGREHRPPDRPRPALVRGALRRALHRGVDPRRVRLPRRSAAGVRRRRDAPLRHAEAVVEPHQPLPPPDVLVGGHRRHSRAHALPAGRHVQRRDHPGRAERRRWSASPSTRGATGR